MWSIEKTIKSALRLLLPCTMAKLLLPLSTPASFHLWANPPAAPGLSRSRKRSCAPSCCQAARLRGATQSNSARTRQLLAGGLIAGSTGSTGNRRNRSRPVHSIAATLVLVLRVDCASLFVDCILQKISHGTTTLSTFQTLHRAVTGIADLSLPCAEGSVAINSIALQRLVVNGAMVKRFARRLPILAQEEDVRHSAIVLDTLDRYAQW